MREQCGHNPQRRERDPGSPVATEQHSQQEQSEEEDKRELNRMGHILQCFAKGAESTEEEVFRSSPRFLSGNDEIVHSKEDLP